MVQIALVLMVLALVLCGVLTWVVRAAGRRLALLDSPGAEGHDKSLRSVPNIGGVAIMLTIVLPVLAGLGLVWFFDAQTIASRLPALEDHLPGLRQQTPMALTLVGSLLLLHIMGLIDDRRAIGPAAKLIVMTGCAAVMVAAFDARLLTLLDSRVGGPWLSIALTIGWIVVVTNAMNFMDNMDGLAAGVGSVAGGLFLAAALANGQWFVAAMLALLVGALMGFLIFNAPRPGGATIFMGDGGSLVVGFLLAFLTVRTTYVGGEGVLAGPSAWYGVFMPLCVLAVPIYDLISVSLIRISQGKSPLVGDHQHFSHRLLRRGLSECQALQVMCGCAAVTGIGGVLLAWAEPWQAILIGIQTLLVLLILGIYEYASASGVGAGGRGGREGEVRG